MISYFAIKNFRSILGGWAGYSLIIKFDFIEEMYGYEITPLVESSGNYNEEDYYPFFEADEKTKLVPIKAFYGANGSGKSNIIKAFSTLQTILVDLTDGIIGKYDPNISFNKLDSSSFEIEFYKDKNKYKFFIEYNDKTILEENLYKNDKKLYSINNKEKQNDFINISKENYSSKKFNSILDVECSDEKSHQIIPFISKIYVGYNGVNRDLVDAYKFLVNNIFVLLDSDNIECPAKLGLDILSTYLDNENELNAFLDEIVSLLKKLDIDISGLAYKVNPILGVGYLVSYHNCLVSYDYKCEPWKEEWKEVAFNFLEQESKGTQRLFSLICLFLDALKKGKVLIIDDLDRNLHSLILKEIIKMFKKKNYNKTNSQLIFTCHNTDILNSGDVGKVFRISEISPVNNTLIYGTHASKLSHDFNNYQDFRELYFWNEMGGIPAPSIL